MGLHSVKILTGIAICISACATILVTVHHYQRTHVMFPKFFSEDNPAVRMDDWEYFTQLPKRYAANHYPPRTTRKEILIKPVLTPKQDRSQVRVTFLVNSEPRSSLKRKAIRGTWGSEKPAKDISLQVLFVVGTDDTYQARLSEEYSTYRDIIQVNIPEKPSNQPTKLLSAFWWISSISSDFSDFFITTKDTCVVNIPTTIEFLLDHLDEVRQSIHCGFMFENNTGVIRGHGPRSISHSLYSKKTYPAFCRSGYVLLSSQYLKKIYEASTITDITDFHLEDVLLYGILREKLKIENSIKNIKNGGNPLVFYPWDDSDKAVLKMLKKWKRWQAEINEALTPRRKRHSYDD